ncbi:MAG: FlaA1/EpsC-like NDP-sugar epimerase, partial [Enterobacterales bacterium]
MQNFFAHSVRQWFLQRSRSVKRIISVSVDVVVVVLALWLAFSLRYSELYLPSPEQLWVFLLPPVLAIPIFIRFGLYRAIIRYIGIEALWAIFKAVALYTLLLATIILLAGPLAGVVPRTVYGINALILILFTGGSRLLAKWWLSDVFSQNQGGVTLRRVGRPILIYGAGASGVQLAESLKSSHQQKPVAFIDDSKQLKNQQIKGLIVYSPKKLAYLIEKFAVRDVLLAMPSVSRHRRNEII